MDQVPVRVISLCDAEAQLAMAIEDLRSIAELGLEGEFLTELNLFILQNLRLRQSPSGVN